MERLLKNSGRRAEFYLDLKRPLQDIWRNLVGECRNMIRKAQKLGVITKVDNSLSSLAILHAFQQPARWSGRRSTPQRTSASAEGLMANSPKHVCC